MSYDLKPGTVELQEFLDQHNNYVIDLIVAIESVSTSGDLTTEFMEIERHVENSSRRLQHTRNGMKFDSFWFETTLKAEQDSLL